MPSLSIVIPTYSEEKYLGHLLDSIKSQTLKPKEIIVADADSTDGTVKIAKKYKAKVVKGGMPAVGRNRGAEKAKGDLILFLDADVVFPDEEFLQRTVEDFEARQLDIGTVDIWPIDGYWHDEWIHDLYSLYVRLIKDFRPHAPGFFILVRRDLHEKIRGFDETIVLLEDKDYGLRAARLGRFGYMNSGKLLLTVRRQNRDGRFNMYAKYVLADLYVALFGPIRTDLFNYTFGHDKEE